MTWCQGMGDKGPVFFNVLLTVHLNLCTGRPPTVVIIPDAV